jgi:Transcription factor Iwr1
MKNYDLQGFLLTFAIDIQSELHQKKRRFTDFIFQRVKIQGGTTPPGSSRDDASSSSPSAPATATLAAQNRLRSPRSVSTSDFPSENKVRRQPAAAAVVGSNGIPAIRATSPGAEFRDESIRAEARRRDFEAKRKRLEEPVSQFLPESEVAELQSHDDDAHGTPASSISEKRSTRPLSAIPSAFPTSLRRFHIARPSTSMDSLKGAAGSGVSKKGSTPSRTRAILVEKLTRAPTLRGASVLQTLEKTADSHAELDTVVQSQVAAQSQLSNTEAAPSTRKRPVVNQAEKKWREQHQTAISAAKEHLAKFKQPQDDALDKLAAELEEVMLDIESEENQMDGLVHHKAPQPSTTRKAPVVTKPKTPLKYQPRHPAPRKTAAHVLHEEEYASDKMMQDADSDGEYVYDTYIRIPLHTAPQLPQQKLQSDIAGYTDPLADANAAHGINGINIDPTRTDIGVVVITSDDEEIWDQYLEEDQDSEIDWDGDDVDSNGTFPLFCISIPWLVLIYRNSGR